jgi:hypothetical protein
MAKNISVLIEEGYCVDFGSILRMIAPSYIDSVQSHHQLHVQVTDDQTRSLLFAVDNDSKRQNNREAHINNQRVHLVI